MPAGNLKKIHVIVEAPTTNTIASGPAPNDNAKRGKSGVLGASTITGIFFKLPAGTLSDIYGRYRMLFLSVLVFAFTPFIYYLVTSYWQLVSLRFFHGLATSIYGPVAMATIADIAGEKKGERLSTFSSITIIGNLIGAPLG